MVSHGCRLILKSFLLLELTEESDLFLGREFLLRRKAWD